MVQSINPWFIWNGENSLTNGLWINRLPKIVRPKERTDTITIPGRAGSLTMLEGEDVYESYVKDCTVWAANPVNMEHLLDWLRGSGDLVFCTEEQFVYKARIAATVEFQRQGNDLLQAKIPFLVEPFKAARYPAKYTVTQTAGSGTIYNPGNVASKPLVHITRTGNVNVTIGGTVMKFKNLDGTIDVDCDAQIVTYLDNGERKIWTGSVEGEFWTIPVGSSSVLQNHSGECTVRIEPNWRWV